MNYKKITIVTPSYNQGAFLEETIDAVLSQGYPNLEYFVVDGGSNDESLAIIKKYEKHIDWWESEKDNGQSHAINKGLKRATGEIFNWINSDDYYQSDALKHVNEAFQEDNITMASFRANVFGLQERTSRGTDIFPGNLPKAIAYSRVDQPETFFRMTAVTQMGLLNEHLHYCMDKEWLLRYFLLFGNSNAINCDQVILNFRYHPASKSVSRNDQFEIETDFIYRCLANEHKEIAKLIDDVLLLDKQVKAPGLELPTDNIEANVLEASLHYFLFKRFIEKYEKLDLDTCMRLFKSIDASYLTSSDSKQLATLEWRSRNMAPQLLKLFRKMTR